MARRISRGFFVLLVVSGSIVLYLCSWDNESPTKRWAAMSAKLSRSRVRGMLFDLMMWGEDGDFTPAPDQLKTQRPVLPETPMPLLYKTNYTKLPQWDFDDVYNQDAPPWHTKCAESLRNSQDQSFREAFLPNVRLFLHKDNINMSEWNRLSHFNNPFGFMGFKYDEVMPTVKLIQKPPEPLLQPNPSTGCVRCAVVGTAGILNGSRKGKEIDGHDYVFRMNGAVIDGHEEDVGKRTSVYVHTAHSITTSLYLFKKYGYKSVPGDEGIKFVMIPEGMRDFNWLNGLLKGERIAEGSYKNRRPRTYYADRFNETHFYVLHQDFLRYVRNRFLKSRNLNAHYWAIVRPTNGAFALFLALHSCDIVSAYGFMTENYKKYSNYYFETNVQTRVVFFSNHDYILEMNLWKKLHDDKILKLYQGPESEPVSAYGFMTENYKNFNNYYFETNVKTRVVFYANHDYILEMNLWKKLHDTKILKLYQGPESEPGTDKLK